jgi:hypothetical protein
MPRDREPRPEVDRLHIAAGAKIPEVDVVAIFVQEQVFRDNPVLELRRQPPFTCHQRHLGHMTTGLLS